MRVLTVVGTRPELIRLSCLIPKLDALCDHVLVHTGQNAATNLRDVFFDELQLRQPDVHLEVDTRSLGAQLGTLFERFEAKLQSYGGNVTRAAVELAKDWRTDRYLRRLEALLAVAAPERLLLISGTGDVIEPDDEIVAIGSGGPFALAATRAIIKHADHLPARQIVEDALHIAADICIYTNHHLTVLELDSA